MATPAELALITRLRDALQRAHEAAQITRDARSIILEVQRGNRNQLILMR